MPLLLLALPLLTAPRSAAAARDSAIAPSVAALFVGQTHVVEGTVTDTARDGNVVRLRFGPAPQSLTVSLVIGLLSDFPADPERYYLGKTVRVAGRLRSFRGVPEIIVRSASDIRVAGLETAGSAGGRAPGEAADTSELRGLVETLGERVRALEEQVRQLGGTPPSPP